MTKLQTIAFVTPLLVNYDRKVAEGVARYIANAPHLRLRLYHMVGFEPMPDRRRFDVDGVLGVFASKKELMSWKRRGIPVVNIGATVSGTPRVHVDDLQIGEMAAHYFLEHRHSNFLYVNCFPYSLDKSVEKPEVSVFDQERQTGFRQGLKAATRDLETLTLDGRRLFSPTTWHKVLAELAEDLSRRPKPLAVFTMADSIGRFVLQACQLANIAVPGDVAVVGVDNDELFCNSVEPPLSSIAQGEERLGWEAALLLDQILQKKTAPDTIIRLDPLGLVERPSSAVTCGDPVIAAGLAHIRKNLTSTISLKALAKQLNLSSRSFERRVTRTMGTSASELITRMRMDKARHLLANTARPLKDVYADCGFASPEHFHRTFKRQFGVPPLAYRRQNRRGLPI
jgi:LacI family transcriptional regulator